MLSIKKDGDKVIVNIGGCWEELIWQVYLDHEVSKYGDVEPCHHCHSRQALTHVRADNSTWESEC